MKSLYLGEGLGVVGREPVHAVHDLVLDESAFADGVGCLGVFLSYYGVAEGAWGDSTDHFLELVGVDA